MKNFTNIIKRYFHMVTNGVNNDFDMPKAMLETWFDMLVDYVEIEKAISYAVVHDMKNKMPTWNPFSERFKLWYRDKELGLLRLEEEMEVEVETDIEIDGKKDTVKSKQAKTAEKVMELYKWWIIRRRRLQDFKELTPAAEDDKMLRELIEIRTELYS